MDPGHRADGDLPTVSVVVPTYRRRDNLQPVVGALLADPATTELIVVVDGCRDGSMELLEELAARDRRLRPLFIDNRGTAGAHQAGVEHARGEVVLLLADDVVAAPGLVTGHARRHRERGGRVVVGYMPVAGDAGGPGRFASALYAREYERCCRLYERDPAAVLRHLWGGNVSLRREDCLRVGVESPRFGERYHEDQDFGIRCLKAGLTGVFDRSLLAHHAHDRSLDGVLRDARRAGAGRVRVHALHQDVLGPLDPAVFDEGLPPPARWVVHLARRRRARALAMALLAPLVPAAGRAHLRRLEVRTAQLLRRIAFQAGALGS